MAAQKAGGHRKGRARARERKGERGERGTRHIRERGREREPQGGKASRGKGRPAGMVRRRRPSLCPAQRESYNT